MSSRRELCGQFRAREVGRSRVAGPGSRIVATPGQRVVDYWSADWLLADEEGDDNLDVPQFRGEWLVCGSR